MTTVGQHSTSPSPRALILTVLGLYVRELGGWISVGRLIGLMAPVGLDAQTVRSAVSRLKKKDLLVAERRGGVAGYALSAHGARVLAEGDQRIFSREVPPEADWVLAVFTVPESEREQRHALRSRLTHLGFATLSPGTWIAPAHVADHARRVLTEEGLARYVALFHADYLGFGDVRALVRRWWDLGDIDARYRTFIADHEPLLHRWQGPGVAAEDQAEAFADYVRVLTRWRQLPYLDPGLPPDLLPEDWPAATAGRLFVALQGLLERPAHRALDLAGDAAGDRP